MSNPPEENRSQLASKSTLGDAGSNLVTQAQLFLSVFQGVHGTGATLPQSLHLLRLLLERLAGLYQSFQLVLEKQTTRVKVKITIRVDKPVRIIGA